MKQRRFTNEFKCQAVEETLGGINSYDLSATLPFGLIQIFRNAIAWHWFRIYLNVA